jgi:hypothetical protein
MTTDNFLADVSRIFDHCPSWCVNSGTSREDQDWHDAEHATSPYSASGGRIFAHLERADDHGKPRGAGSVPYIALSQNDLDICRMSVPEARSLARILTHLADLEEL